MKQQSPSRISMKTIYLSFFAVFNFEKGLTYTIKNLLIRPGGAIRDYLYTEKRSKHIKPINFLFLTITIATFVTFYFLGKADIVASDGTEIKDVMSGSALALDGLVSPKMNEAITFFNKLTSKYYHIFQMLKVPFFALVTFWFFKRKQFNYAEHLIVNTYIMGMSTFLFIIVSPTLIINVNLFSILVFGGILYMFIAFMLIYEEMTFKGFFKSIGSYLVATLLHLLFSSLIVVGIYMFI